MALLVGTLEIAKSPSFEAGRLGYIVQLYPLPNTLAAGKQQ